MYYIKGANNRIYGPFPAEKVRDLLANHKIPLNVLVSTDQKTWQLLKKVPEFASVDTPQSSATPVKTTAAADSSSTAADNNMGQLFASIGHSSKPKMSFDFLQNNNSSASSGNANNSLSQQSQQSFSMNPTPVQSVPVQQVAAPSAPAMPEEQWFISSDGVNGYGPYPTSQVVSMIQNGQILPNYLTWRNGETAVQIAATPSFGSFFNGGAAGYNGSMSMSNNRYGSKGRKRYHGPTHSRTTYILLGLFFGGFGVHNFYAGYSSRGAIQLISTCLCVGCFFVPIWVLIEICTETRDANGVPFE